MDSNYLKKVNESKVNKVNQYQLIWDFFQEKHHKLWTSYQVREVLDPTKGTSIGARISEMSNDVVGLLEKVKQVKAENGAMVHKYGLPSHLMQLPFSHKLVQEKIGLIQRIKQMKNSKLDTNLGIALMTIARNRSISSMDRKAIINNIILGLNTLVDLNPYSIYDEEQFKTVKDSDSQLLSTLQKLFSNELQALDINLGE